MKPGLIVDVGMHHGDDTAYYLSKGFKVVGIEANPDLVASAAARFRPNIEAGDLVLHHVAVAEHTGEIDLFIGGEDLWASTRAEMANRGIHRFPLRKVRVPCAPLAEILRGCPRPHYVKIDVEGSDGDCIRSLADMPEKPRYVSFEVDLTNEHETVGLVDVLGGYGYSMFKLVNQAQHGEGFTKQMSGPVGEETHGAWVHRDRVVAQYHEIVRRQAARISYSATGKVYGIPLGWGHAPLERLYNARAIARTRALWAGFRGVDVGGWYDMHAALGQPVTG